MHNDEHDDWVDLSPFWMWLESRASDRHTQKSSFASTRNWNSNPHFIGLCGELAYAIVHRLPLDSSLRICGDDGEDFKGGVDVKSSSYYHDPILKHPVSSQRFAKTYALMAVDCKGRRARYVGSASAEQLRGGVRRDFGYGPQYTLSAKDLLDNKESSNE